MRYARINREVEGWSMKFSDIVEKFKLPTPKLIPRQPLEEVVFLLDAGFLFPE
jgi:hypothetical protein